MNDQYTSGYIISEPFTDAAGAVHQLRMADVAPFSDGVLARFISQGNGKRLAAAWNAFHGIDTENIERLALAGGVQNLARKGEKAAMALAASLTAEAMLRESLEARNGAMEAARALIAALQSDIKETQQRLANRGLEDLASVGAEELAARVHDFLKERA